MFNCVLKTPLKASIKTSASSSFLALASVWLNTFFLLPCKFLFLPVSKKDLHVLSYKTFISIQTNNYVKTCTSMQISRCHQDKTMVSDNFKRNLHHFNMKKVEHVQLFYIKIKRIKSSFFVKYTVILI